MTGFDVQNLVASKRLPPLTIGPITRQTLALYAGAGGDHNPIHIDIDFAKRAGYEDVFAHGMLVMAYLGRLITDAIPPASLKSYSTRFLSITQVGDTLTCSGEVTETVDGPHGRLAKLSLRVTNSEGVERISALAVVDINE